MRFYSLLRSGTSPRTITQRFVAEMLLRNRDLRKFDLEIAANFINDVMQSVGFDCSVTQDEIYANTRNLSAEQDNYNWPIDRHTYVFQCDSELVARLGKFLELISEVVMEHSEEEEMDIDEFDDDVDDDIDKPVEVLMELLSHWCSASRHLQSAVFASNFEEPLAIINYFLLLGLHKLRMRCGDTYPMLDNICDRLYCIAVRGILYLGPHRMIVDGLLAMFKSDFDVFYNFQQDTLDLYYQIFSVANQRKSYISTYKVLTQMLDSHDNEEERRDDAYGSNKLLTLTNILVTNQMLNVYYMHLRFDNTTRLKRAVLDFLTKLQSKLPTLDVFTQDFIEAILPSAVNPDLDIGGRAVDLYMVMMRRILPDHLILKHLIEFYATTEHSPQCNTNFVNAFWPYFPNMRSVKAFITMIRNTHSDLIRSFSCYALINVYKILQEKIATRHETVLKILHYMPPLLADLNCLVARDILLNIYVVSDFNVLKDYIRPSLLKQCLMGFEQFAAKEFMENRRLDFNQKLNLFTQLHNSISYTHNWNTLEILSNEVYQKYRTLNRTLTDLGPNEQPSLDILHDYNHSLMQLNLVMKLDYQILDFIEEIYETLGERLIMAKRIVDYINRTNFLMDVYIVNILTSCVKMFFQSKANDTNEAYQYCRETTSLLKYLFSYLHEQNLKNQPFIRLVTAFNCIITIYCISNSNNTFNLQLESRAYNVLLNVLIKLTVNAHELNERDINGTKMHKAYVEKLQKSMIQHFTRLHNMPNLKEASNVWKICIFYGQSKYKTFEDDICGLLRTLARKHYATYVHCLIVLVYNLHKQQPPLKNRIIRNSIFAHEKFMNSRIVNTGRRLKFREAIVLGVIRQIEKSLEAYPLGIEHNRLAPLKYLTTFTNGLDNVTSQNIFENIRQKALSLKQYVLTTSEDIELKNFLKSYVSE